MAKINLYHLYPHHLNLYGDRGNMLALIQRAKWRSLGVNLVEVQPGEKINFTSCDLLFMGGGQDYEQKLVAEDLKQRRGEMIKALEEGMVILAICGSYQLLGQHYYSARSEKIPGLEILELYTRAGGKRLISNIVTRCSLWDPPRNLAGFENHAGRTYLAPGLQPLGEVITGFGNNGKDKTEGVIYKNVIGTYMHGALLPKNPWLTDYLLQKALIYRNQEFEFEPLDDTLEKEAHAAAAQLSSSRLHKFRSARP